MAGDEARALVAGAAAEFAASAEAIRGVLFAAA